MHICAYDDNQIRRFARVTVFWGPPRARHTICLEWGYYFDGWISVPSRTSLAPRAPTPHRSPPAELALVLGRPKCVAVLMCVVCSCAVGAASRPPREYPGASGCALAFVCNSLHLLLFLCVADASSGNFGPPRPIQCADRASHHHDPPPFCACACGFKDHE